MNNEMNTLIENIKADTNWTDCSVTSSGNGDGYR